MLYKVVCWEWRLMDAIRERNWGWLYLNKHYLAVAHRPQVAYSTCYCLSSHPSKYWTGSSPLNFGAMIGCSNTMTFTFEYNIVGLYEWFKSHHLSFKNVLSSNINSHTYYKNIGIRMFLSNIHTDTHLDYFLNCSILLHSYWDIYSKSKIHLLFSLTWASRFFSDKI